MKNIEINRLGFLILSILLKNNIVTYYHSITLNELKMLEDSIPESKSTFYRILRNLKEKGLIAAGVQDGKSFTYYITKKGIDFLNQKEMEE